MRWGTLRRLLGAICLLAFAPAYAGEVYFGGFAYLGNFKSHESQYPYTSALADNSGGQSELDAALASKVRNASAGDMQFVVDHLGSLAPDTKSSIALGFALDRESTAVEKIGSAYRITIDIAVQALFFDFKEKAVLASIPVNVRYIDAKPAMPTHEEIASLYHDLYLGNLGVNVVDEFVSALSKTHLQQNVARRIQVTNVDLAPEASPVLAQAGVVDLDAWKTALAQDFSAYLSKNQAIPVLPYTAGNAIGNRMAARFADGAVFELKMPEPDYVISITLEKLKKIEYQSNAAGTSWVYGNYLHVRVLEPLSGKSFFDASMKNGITILVPTGQENIAEAAAYEESLLALLDKFTQAPGKADAAWAERYLGDKSAVQQLNILGGVLQSCR